MTTHVCIGGAKGWTTRCCHMCCRGAATRRRGEKRPKLCLLFVAPKDGSHKNEFSRKIPAGRNKSLKTLLSVCLFLSTLFWWQQAVGISYLWPTWIMDDFCLCGSSSQNAASTKLDWSRVTFAPFTYSAFINSYTTRPTQHTFSSSNSSSSLYQGGKPRRATTGC